MCRAALPAGGTQRVGASAGLPTRAPSVPRALQGRQQVRAARSLARCWRLRGGWHAVPRGICQVAAGGSGKTLLPPFIYNLMQISNYRIFRMLNNDLPIT